MTRRVPASVAFALIVIALVHGSAVALPITTNLIAHWALDETSGTTAFDSEPTAPVHNGSLLGFAGNQWRTSPPALIGGALEFIPVDRIQVPNNAELNLTGTSFTVSAWARPDATDGRRTIFFHGQHSVQWGNWGMGIGSAGESDAGNTIIPNKYMFYMRTSAGASYQAAVSDPINAVIGDWTHVLATYDNTVGSEALRLYIDGVLVATRAGAVNMFNSNTNLQMGGDAQTGGGSERSGFDGLLDDLGIWRRGLTAREIAALAGLGRFAQIDLADPGVDLVLALDSVGQSAEAGGLNWYYTNLFAPDSLGRPLTLGLHYTGVDGESYIVLDQIGGVLYGVSTAAIPEPATLTLLALGGLGLLSRRRRRKA